MAYNLTADKGEGQIFFLIGDLITGRFRYITHAKGRVDHF